MASLNPEALSGEPIWESFFLEPSEGKRVDHSILDVNQDLSEDVSRALNLLFPLQPLSSTKSESHRQRSVQSSAHWQVF